MTARKVGLEGDPVASGSDVVCEDVGVLVAAAKYLERRISSSDQHQHQYMYLYVFNWDGITATCAC